MLDRIGVGYGLTKVIGLGWTALPFEGTMHMTNYETCLDTEHFIYGYSRSRRFTPSNFFGVLK